MQVVQCCGNGFSGIERKLSYSDDFTKRKQMCKDWQKVKNKTHQVRYHLIRDQPIKLEFDMYLYYTKTELREKTSPLFSKSPKCYLHYLFNIL